MSSIRVFFAIIPPKTMNPLLITILESLKQSLPEHWIRWTHVDNVHITLQFLKSIQSQDVPPLIERVHSELKNTPKFQLDFHGLEWFPSVEHPKILSLAVGPKDILKNLSAIIGHAISALNYPVESRPFRGHMSLGRLPKFNLQQKNLLDEIRIPVIPPIFISELYLMESKPSKGGINYHPLAQLNLIP